MGDDRGLGGIAEIRFLKIPRYGYLTSFFHQGASGDIHGLITAYDIAHNMRREERQSERAAYIRLMEIVSFGDALLGYGFSGYNIIPPFMCFCD